MPVSWAARTGQSLPLSMDIGDQVPLTVAVTDATGAPAAAGAMVVTVTLPDGTTATPAVTIPTVGTYQSDYVAVQAGLHQVSWVATGANAGAFADCFAIYPPASMLVSVAEVVTFLTLNNVPTPYTERLRSFIAGVTAVVEGIVGTILTKQLDEFYDGGSATILLDYPPVLAVSSVKESGGGGFIRTLTEQAADSSNVDAFGYSLDKASGTLIRRVSGVAVPFLPGRRNVHVVYSAGTAVPGANIREGALELIRVNWQPQQGGNRPGYDRPGQGDVDTSGSWRLGFFVPGRVMEMLAPSRSSWGIA